MPTRTPASRSSWMTLAYPALSGTHAPASPQTGVAQWLAFVRRLTWSERPSDDHWLTACYRLTPRLQRYGHDAILLDLGLCAYNEAISVIQALIKRLADWGVTIRAAIGPNSVLAQFALFHASASESLVSITSEQANDLLRDLPVATLARLHLAAPHPITAELLARLDGYGIRTVAQVARLDEEQMIRQFGAHVGKILATLARGEDILPFQPTPAPLRLSYRLRLTASVTPDRLWVGLPQFAGEVALALARRGIQARTLELRLRWESGVTNRVTRTLSHPIAASRTLGETIERLLAPLVEARSGMAVPDAINDLRLVLTGLTPRYPEQHSFWPQRAARVAAARDVAAVLARRHGKSLLFRAALTSPEAIFEQNRVQLAPLDADVLEGPNQGRAWPPADVSSSTSPAPREEIRHGTHWW